MTLSRKEGTFVNKLNIKTNELFEAVPWYLQNLFGASKYPWEILPKIKEIVANFIENGIEGYTLLEEGILVGENVKIAKTATICAPAIIGHNTEIRPGHIFAVMSLLENIALLEIRLNLRIVFYWIMFSVHITTMLGIQF